MAASSLLRDVYAGILVMRDGGLVRLSGLRGDPLLEKTSTLLSWIRGGGGDGETHAVFLWPGRDEPTAHVRVTRLRMDADPPSSLLLLSPSGDRHGLTAREFEVLGGMIDGCSNAQIADHLTVAQRTVATHIEHILAKLGSPTRTHAAVRAQREGLYVPLMQPSADS